MSGFDIKYPPLLFARGNTAGCSCSFVSLASVFGFPSNIRCFSKNTYAALYEILPHWSCPIPARKRFNELPLIPPNAFNRTALVMASFCWSSDQLRAGIVNKIVGYSFDCIDSIQKLHDLYFHCTDCFRLLRRVFVATFHFSFPSILPSFVILILHFRQ